MEDLEKRRSLELFGWALNQVTSVHVRDTEKTHRGEDKVRTDQRKKWPQAEECQQPEAGDAREELSLSTSKGSTDLVAP